MLRGTALALLTVLTLSGATADGRPGVFDFYLLSLSWSPTYCEGQSDRANRMQCESAEPKAFIVHGLWPQYERGYPEYCRTELPDFVPRSLTDTMLDIMPSPGLVGGQWRKHGTCSGLSQDDYLAEVRKAYGRVEIPDLFEDPTQRRITSARDVEQAFIAVNPGLSANGIAVSCKAGRVSEVRICLSRSLEFRRCPDVDRNGCMASRLVMPADQ